MLSLATCHPSSPFIQVRIDVLRTQKKIILRKMHVAGACLPHASKLSLLPSASPAPLLLSFFKPWFVAC